MSKESVAWPDGSEQARAIYVCPECGRIEGPEFGMVPEGEPVFCNRHPASAGYIEMVRVPVLPASMATDLALALDKLNEAMAPYVERAAPHERMNGEWCAIYDQLGVARYSANEALTKYHAALGEGAGK